MMEDGFEVFWQEESQFRFADDIEDGAIDLPDFELITTSGERLRRLDFVGRPLVMTLASLRCPVTLKACQGLKDIANCFAGEVNFLTIYCDRIGADSHTRAKTFQQRLERARRYKARDEIRWPVAIDASGGRLEGEIDLNRTAFLVAGSSGAICFRLVESDDTDLLGQAVASVLEEERSGRLSVMMGRDRFDIPGPSAEGSPVLSLASLTASGVRKGIELVSRRRKKMAV